MSSPTVSVIIATRNRSDLCLRAVKSALAQTRPPLEVIVCDDASTDATREIMEHHGRTESRVRYLPPQLKSAQGPAATRNRGIEAARGTLLAFLDDDDTWLPEKLERQLPVHDAHGGIVCSNAILAGGGPYFEQSHDRSFTRGDLARDNPIILSTALVARADVVGVGGFPTDRRSSAAEDYSLWLRLGDRGLGITRVAIPLALYDARSPGRRSDRRIRVRASLALLAGERWLDDPRDRMRREAAWRNTAALTASVVEWFARSERRPASRNG